jgi:hypothetical protein
MGGKWAAVALVVCGVFANGVTPDAWAVATNVNLVAGGSPVAKAKVKVTLNDGSTTEGTTDSQGQTVLNVDPQSVRETEVTTEDGNKRRLVGAWFLTGNAVMLDLQGMSPVTSSLGAGASTGAVPLGKLIGSTTLRFYAFGGLNLANDVRDVSGTGTISNSTFSKFTTTDGFSTGAGFDWKWPTGWTFGVNYQFLQQGIKGQTVQETFTSGGFSSTSPQLLIGGSLKSNVAVFNFGYEWDCWKIAGKTLSLGLAGGPVVGSTTFSTFIQNMEQSTTRGASGYDAQATLRYPITDALSGFVSYQYMHLHSDISRISIGGGPVSIQGDINSNLIRFGVSYALSLQPYF